MIVLQSWTAEYGGWVLSSNPLAIENETDIYQHKFDRTPSNVCPSFLDLKILIQSPAMGDLSFVCLLGNFRLLRFLSSTTLFRLFPA